jgi:tetratricopeptide (TPR) repeat protein
MSFPPQSQSPQQPSFSQPRGPEPGRRRVWGVAWLFLLAALGGTAITQAPLEIGRWHLAWAMKHRAAGEKDAAYRELAAAIEKFPRSPELLLQRAEWKLRDGEREGALADCDRAVEIAGDSPGAFLLRGQLLFKAGEFAKAVDDFKKIEQFSRRSGRPPRQEALNQLAYAQALAKIELDDALENANRALDLKPRDAHILDTRGYVRYARGELDDALSDLNEAVEGIDAQLEKVQPISSRDNPPLKEQSSSLREIQSEQSLLTEASAVIHYHRALVLAALDRKEEAEKDLAVARDLMGREPDETLF